MSSTPEINHSVKFSPYGKPISKTLLTPCRPMGLSRKRKTPSSMSRTPLNSSIIKECMSPPITPLNQNTPVSKNEIKQTSTERVNKRSKRSDENKNNRVKKCLDENFKTTILKENECKTIEQTSNNEAIQEHNLTPVNLLVQEVTNTGLLSVSTNTRESKQLRECMKDFKVSIEKLNKKDLKIHNNHSENIVTEDHCEVMSNCSSNESEEIFIVKKRSAVILSDDEDCVVATYEDKNIKDSNEKQNSCSNLTYEGGIKKVKTDLILNTKSCNLGDDDDFILKTGKGNKNKLTLSKKESSEKYEGRNIKESKIKSAKSKGSNTSTMQLTKSSQSLVDDEEDAFTSTPEREKNEKIALIEKIRNIENQVAIKKKTLEALKQAQIYQTKHNIADLKHLTEMWRKGCLRGLNELLTRVQTHGPMNMVSLLNSLNISEDVARKCLKLELKEEKKDENLLRTDSEDL